MASHHRHRHRHPTAATNSCCCCSCCTSCNPCHQHPPPPDPLLQSIASHVFRHPPPPPQPHLYSPYPNPPYDPHNLHEHQTQYYPPQPRTEKQQFGRRHQRQEEQTLPIFSSLLHRIAALESTLRHHFPASYSVRDGAACTIQTHFRAFLVRRSRTLRQLEDLAFIKSNLNALKSSLSDDTHFDAQALSRKAMNLLLKLDSIQGDDPMIRDGKRSISRELVRFNEYIDGISVRRHGLPSRAVKNVRFGGNASKSRVFYSDRKMGTAYGGHLGGNHGKLMQKLKGHVEKIHGFSRFSEEDDEEDVELENPTISVIRNCGLSQNRSGGLVKRHDGVQAKVKKSVSFAENGNVYRVFGSSPEPVSNGDCNSIDESDSIEAERELVDNLCREVEDIEVSSNSKEAEADEEAHTEDRGSPEDSDGEINPRRSLRTGGKYEMKRHDQGEDGTTFVFSAPLPVKMESRAGFMNGRKTVKIVK